MKIIDLILNHCLLRQIYPRLVADQPVKCLNPAPCLIRWGKPWAASSIQLTLVWLSVGTVAGVQFDWGGPRVTQVLGELTMF